MNESLYDYLSYVPDENPDDPSLEVTVAGQFSRERDDEVSDVQSLAEGA